MVNKMSGNEIRQTFIDFFVEHGHTALPSMLRIHLDRGEAFDNLRDKPHQRGMNRECTRFLELWNNVFIQYNLFDDGHLEALLQKHVDTGIGFDRIVLVLQDVDCSHRPTLYPIARCAAFTLWSLRKKMLADFTLYRVVCGTETLCCGLRFPIRGCFVSNLGYE